MAANIVTLEDLDLFKVDLIQEFKTIIETLETPPLPPEEKVWLKSHQVQRLLKISPGTLQTLRINGVLPYSKIGGTIFYLKTDIERVLEENMRNKPFNG